MSLIFYSRPPYTARPSCPADPPTCQRLAEKMAGKGIPDDLSFDKMLNNLTLPVCFNRFCLLSHPLRQTQSVDHSLLPPLVTK